MGHVCLDAPAVHPIVCHVVPHGGTGPDDVVLNDVPHGAADPASRSRELPSLVLARTASVLGDQLARVALSALVLQRTGSVLLSALTFAATFIPAVVGTALLSGAADRLPRRGVLVGGDLARGALVLLMAVPGVTVPVILLLAVAVTMIDGPSGAARAALLRQVSGGDRRYQRWTALDETATQTGQVLGYIAGGLAVAALGFTTSLVVDAATFALSAALLQLALARRPASVCSAGPAVRAGDALVGWRAVMAPACRLPVLVTWIVVGAAIAPEALALAWARELGAGPAGAGVLLAANPVGGVVGLLLLSRVSPRRAQKMLLPCVGLALLPLLLGARDLTLTGAVVLVALSGAGLTCSTIARVMFAAAVGDATRGRAFGVASTGVIVSQGLGIAAAGALTTVMSPGTAVGACAALGLVGTSLTCVAVQRAADAAAATHGR